MGLGWEGEKVRLVPLDFDRHFENCYRWINDPDTNEWLAVGDFPMSRLAEKEWFEARQLSTSPEAIPLVDMRAAPGRRSRRTLCVGSCRLEASIVDLAIWRARQ